MTLAGVESVQTDRRTLIGRDSYRVRLQQARTSARAGVSDRIHLVGAPGSGRTSLLDELADGASDFLVLRARPVAAEARLAYAALSDLCRPILHLVEELPALRREPLAGALTLQNSVRSNPMAVGAALLSLLTAAARQTPVLVLIDDLEAADAESAEALSFAVRRLDADPVAVVVAGVPELAPGFGAGSFEIVALEPLNDDDSACLLERFSPVPLAPEVKDALLSVAQGNPRALELMCRSLSLAQLRGRWPLPNPLPSVERLADLVAHELTMLSPEASWALVVLAASFTGARTTVESALAGLGVPTSGVQELLARGLVVEDRILRFARPLVRSVVYAGASDVDRRRAHGALGEVIGGEHALEHRSWHLAAAVVGPHAEAADLLQDAGDEWRHRGALASSAAAYDRAVALTPDLKVRAKRRVMAASTLLALGESERASVHLAQVHDETDDTEVLASALHLRGRILVNQGSGSAGQSLLGDGGRMAGRCDPDLGALMLCEAALAAVHGCRFVEGLDLAEAGLAIEGLTSPAERLANVVMGVVMIASGDVAGSALLRSHLAVLDAEQANGRAAPILDGAALALVWSERYDEARALLDRLIDERRRSMAFGLLAPSLSARALVNIRSDRFVQAYADAVEALRLIEGEGSHAQRASALAVLASVEAALGYEGFCLGHVMDCLAVLGDQGRGGVLRRAAMSAAAALELSCGRPDRALAWLERLQAQTTSTKNGSPALVLWEADLAEALVLAGRRDEAKVVLDGLEARATIAGNRRALGAAARCRGMLAEDVEVAAACFSSSLAAYADPPHHAGASRTELAWGERLLAEGRPEDARAHLERALVGFEQIWSSAWADRASAAMAIAGFAIPRRNPPIRLLSPEAAEVALLSAAGFDVAKVAAHLVVSEQSVQRLLAEATAALGDAPVRALRNTVRAVGETPAPLLALPTETSRPRTGRLTVRVLGGFVVTRGEDDITPLPGLGARLVKLLAVAGTGEGMQVDEVIDVLWPDVLSDAGRVRLRNVLSRLRQSSGELVARDGEWLRLAADAVVDLHRFERLARAALIASKASDSEAPSLARAALAAHGGALLPDSPYDAWATSSRERVRRRLLELLDLLAADHQRAGRTDDAVRLMERGIELDTYDEERYVAAAELRLAQGRHGAALSLVRRAREIVTDLGLAPSPHLLEIEHQLRH